MTNPYASQSQPSNERTDDRGPLAGDAVWPMYWNAGLAILALACYLTPFAAFAMDNSKGSAGFALFPLAGLGTLTLMFCFVVGCLQAILLIRAFVVRSPFRKHRMASLSIVAGSIAGWCLAVYLGWAIRV